MHKKCEVCNNEMWSYSRCVGCGNLICRECEGNRDNHCTLCSGFYNPADHRDESVIEMLSAPTLHTSSGWLTPDGTLYPCPAWAHFGTLADLVKYYGLRYHSQMDDKYGFIKLSKGSFMVTRHEVTQKQFDAISEWMTLHGARYVWKELECELTDLAIIDPKI